MKLFSKITALLMSLFITLPLFAQSTMEDMQILTVNDKVTTLLTAGEPIKMVDISTNLVAGDQPIDNTVRLKPKEGSEKTPDGTILGIVTIVTERYRVQYAMVYTSKMEEAVSDKEIKVKETRQYNNPAVSMSTEEMSRYARRIWCSPAKFRGISTKQNMMVMRVNNIYAVGEYFFIDFSVENKTKIRFDIDQMKIKLQDKKTTKATTNQTLELTPALILDPVESFLTGYRNVIVIKKLTFPNDKVLTIEMSEKQISGRTITLNIDYEDVLNADAFSRKILIED